MRAIKHTLLVCLLAVAGCATQPDLGTPQGVVNEARILTVAIAEMVKEQNASGLMSDAVAQGYLTRARALDKQADQVQALIDLGKGDMNQATLLRAALFALQREVAQRAAAERAKRGIK